MAKSEHIDGDVAAGVVRSLCGKYDMESLMTFGGEPLLYADQVFKIHTAAKEMNIPKRQIITNGYFSKEEKRIRETAVKLVESGVNDICLSVDAFHQESIPLEPVKIFAEEVRTADIRFRVHPAWLVDADNVNPYNQRTKEILAEFEQMGIAASKGNNIFPSGNALKYLSEYFDMSREYVNPYDQDPEDVRAICVNANGDIDVLAGNVYREDILDMIG